jgi:hypothetical protein
MKPIGANALGAPTDWARRRLTPWLTAVSADQGIVFG